MGLSITFFSPVSFNYFTLISLFLPDSFDEQSAITIDVAITHSLGLLLHLQQQQLGVQ
jgi:hypothetical protein